MADRCLLYYITDRSQFRGDESARRRALLATVAEAARAGANAFVAGSAVFKDRTPESYRANIAAIRQAAALVRGEAA